MAIIKRTYVSNEQPQVVEGLWLKKVEGGYALYLIEGGSARPLKIVEDKGTANPSDDTVQNLIGSSQDTKTSDTINGAKAYADDAVATVSDDLIGTAQDESTADTINGAKAYANYIAEASYAELVGDPTDAASNMTLYGLKAYIDSKVDSGGETSAMA